MGVDLGIDLGIDLGPACLLRLSESGWVVVIEISSHPPDFAGPRSANRPSALPVSPGDALPKIIVGGDLQAGRPEAQASR